MAEADLVELQELALSGAVDQPLPEHLLQAATVIDLAEAGLLTDKRLEVSFDPEQALLIAPFGDDLAIIDENDVFIVIKDFVPGVTDGVLDQILLPDGSTMAAPEFLDEYGLSSGLAEALAEIETAAGQTASPNSTTHRADGRRFENEELEDGGTLQGRSGGLGDDDDQNVEDEDGSAGNATRFIRRGSDDDEQGEGGSGGGGGGGDDAPDTNADGANLTVDGSASGLEDAAIPLTIEASLNDLDGSETLAVTVSGLPDGATLSAGVYDEVTDSWVLTADQLNGLTLTPPDGLAGSLELTIRAIAVESNGGARAITTDTIDIDITAVADDPTLSVEAASGLEDTAIDLDITSALSDTDGSETLSVEISGIPDGAVLTAGGNAVTVTNGTATLTPDQLSDLSITPPTDSADDFNLTVTSTATDGDDTATSTATLPVTVTGVADAADLTAADASGNEDSAIALDIDVSGVADGDSASVTITGLPDGATLSAGTVNDDGSVTLTTDQLDGLTVTPAADSDADFQLTVAVTTTDADSGDTETVTETLDVTVDAVADTPSLSVEAASGSEDTAIDLDITSALSDTDGSETLSVEISGIPDGAVLTAGGDAVTVTNGTATLTPDQLSDLSITPPADSADDFNLTVTSTATDGSDTATSTATLPVTVTGVADAADLTAADASGNEDSAIALDIDVSGVADGDSASVTISGLPDGATLSAGTVNDDGSVTLTTDQLDGLTVTPTADSDADFQLTVAVTTTDADSGDTETVTETLDVTVDAVADTPSLSVEAASGSEDTAIDLDITSALSDTDGSETLSVEISGIPDGAVLTAGGDAVTVTNGSATLTPDQLSDLSITPPADSADDFNLTVTSTATDGSDTATSTATLPVTVTGVADAADLTAADATGNEDSAIALDIDVSGVADGDSASVTITGLPDGATLSAGTVNDDGSVTLTTDQLDGLTVTPASDSDADFQLTVAVTTTDADSGDTETVTETLDVTVDAVADTPSLSVEAASGSEDTAIDLDITSALSDTDGSETLSVEISGIPDGAVLTAGGDAVTVTNGSATLTPDQLSDLSITPPTDSADDFNLTVTSTATDGNDTATSTATLPVTVTGVADAADLTAADASGNEDSAIALDIDVSGVADGDSASVTVSGLPEGATLSTGTVNDDGSVTLTTDQLDGLTVTPATDSDADFQLTVAVTTTDADSGDTETVTETLDVTVDAVAGTPSLSVEAASGSEDTAIDLDITSALSDTDGSETLSVEISGIPDGAVLTAGGDAVTVTNGTATLTPDQLSDLSITPPADSADDFNLTVTSTATDGNDTATSMATLPVTVTGVADAADLTTADASGNEDSAIALDIDVSGLADGDSASVTITGLPDGATLSAGTVNEDGSVTLTTDQLDGLTVTPASDSDADFQLTVAVTTTDTDSGDTETVTETLDVTVDAVADTPSLSVEAASGSEDTAIDLDITSALSDTDGSETLSVEISGIPDGAVLTAGGDAVTVTNGTATLTPDQLSDLSITPPADSADDFNLTVTSTATDGNDTATSMATLPVTVTGVADAADLTAADASGSEDSAIALDIDVSGVADGDSASVTITGLPDGATLSAGTVNDDGSVTLTTDQLEGLTVTPASDSDADFQLTVAVTTTDADSGDTETVTETLDVTVDAVADTPSLSVEAASGSEDTAIGLDITSALSDTDGSETLSVEISGIPDGAVLTAGGDAVTVTNGTATLTPDQLSDLSITPPTDSADDFNLTVTSTATDGNDTATSTATLPVTVTGVADAADLTAADASGNEDSAIALDIDVSGVADGDSASVTISGLPDGATLSAGTVNDDGSVTLTTDQLDGLSVTPASDSDADFQLTVAVTTTDADSGDAETVTETLDVTVDAVADTPSLSVEAASGSEDTAIDLDITSALSDTDGSETLSVEISGIPDGAVLTAGGDAVNVTNGTATLTPDQLSDLSITPPADSADDFNLTVTSTATDGDDTATSTATLPVTVTGVADAADLTAADASGSEDSAIALDIDVSGVADGDSASVTITGLPDGATLSAGTVNDDGSVTLTTDQLDGLTVTPAADSDADFQLTVAVTTTDADSGDTETVTETLDVTVDAVADTPSLSVEAASGSEDTAIDLDITSALSDTDGSETLSVEISGIPDGAVLTAGGDAVTVTNGKATLTPDQLSDLSITPPTDSADDFNLTVTSTATDGSDTATSTATLPVTVTGVADAADLTAADASGNEDSAIALDIDVSGVADGDSASVTISGLPVGATLSAGTVNDDGSVTLTTDQLDGLTVTPASDSDADFQLTVAVTTTDADSGDTETVTDTLDVTVDAVADTPSLSVEAASGAEDTAIDLDITSALSDTDGSETLSVEISGIPDGAVLTAGGDAVTVTNGSATLTPDQLSDLSITPPADSADDFNLTVTSTATDGSDTATSTATLPVTVTGVADAADLTAADATGNEDSAIALDIDVSGVADGDSASVTISGLPDGATLSAGTVNDDGSVTLTTDQLDGLSVTPASDSDADFQLTVAVTTTDADSGDTETVTETLDVTVDAVADTPSLSVEAASGSEDTAIGLDITSALSDTDGSETLSVEISGIPDGAVLTAGGDAVNVTNGTATLTPDQLSDLSITPPADSADDFNLTVTSTATDGNDTATSTATLPVTVTGVADAADLTAADASGNEDSAIALDIDVSGVADGDSASVTISGLPDGATLSAGTVNDDGSVTLTTDQLDGLSVTPASDSDAGFQLTVAVTTTDADSGDTETVTETLNVTVDAVADTPSLSVEATSGAEDTAIDLDITSALSDTDGSETLSVEISGIPDGAVLTAGGDAVTVTNGTATLTPDQLSDLSITPPTDSADDFNLTVTSTATDGNDTATSTATLPVTVTGVADAADLTAADASGNEDSAIALDIDVSGVADGDSASVTISGLPDGATLSAGTVNDDGSVTLTTDQLDGLTVTSAADSDADFQLTVAVTTTDADSGDTETVTETLDVTVDAVADTPSLSVEAASGSEDTAIDLDITSALSDTDGSETLSVEISGIPEGAVLTAGGNAVTVTNGTATLTPDQLSDLSITPPADSADDFNLTVTSTATDGSDTATSTATLPVTVTGVADAADLTAADASGNEDSAIALDIDVSGVADGDSASVTISGMPDGATLSAGTVNDDGSVTLTTDQLDGLTVTPASDSDADFQLTVAVTTTDADSGDTETVTDTLDVTVDAVADTPSLSVEAASGSEDTAIGLDITSALSDTDGSETLSVEISGIPAGAVLTAGGDAVTVTNGTATLTPDQLSDLSITPPADSADDFNLTVTSTATDGNDTATSMATLPVTVTGVADAADLTAADASGSEDSAIALDIDVSGVADGDSASVTLTGLPDGATLSAGTVNDDGSVTLTTDQLDGLTVTPAADSDADFQLTVAVTTTDADSGDTETVTETLDVIVDAVADTPSLSVEAASGSEDTAIDLDITSALSDTDGSETLSVEISGIPDGAVLTAGGDAVTVTNGSATLTPDQLSDLSITPPTDSADDFNLTVTSTATDGNDTATSTATLPVTVTGVADAADLTAADASGNEDSAIALDIDVSGVADGDSASVTISGLPDGATLSAGTVNDDGSVTLTTDQLDGLTVTPAADSDADFQLTVAVTTTDADSGDTETVTETLDVTVDAVADTPSLSVETASGSEDTAIDLDITSALSDTDGSETLSVEISGIPDGAVLTAGGDAVTVTNGTATLTPDQLSDLSITPPADSADDFNLTVTSTATDGSDTATSTATLPVTVTGVADAADLTTADASGNEDSAIALDIDVSGVADGDSASVTITGLPEGATLSAGTVNDDGSVTLTTDQLDGLTVTPAADSDADFQLTVAVTTTDADSGDTETVTDTLDVTVDAVADTPSLSVEAASGSEDTAIDLEITSALSDTDGSETLSVEISGIPAGAVLTAGGDAVTVTNGTATLTPDQLSDLSITPPTDSADDFNLTVTSTATDGSDTAISTATLPVTVTGVADAADLTAADASGNEDSAIALDIDVSGVAGGDSASVTISGLPDGATLSAGTVNDDGSVTLTTDQLDGLSVTPASDSDADFQLTVAVTTTDADSGDTETVTETLDVTVDAVADTPSLSVEAASGAEDMAINLDITSALSDTDGSETLSVEISGIPDGAVLTAGGDAVNVTNGTATLTPDQLSDLSITPPADSADDFNLTVTSTATDGNDTATSTATLPVTVTGVADAAELTAADASGNEDSAIALDIDVSGVAGGDSASVTITGLPDGATLSAGTVNDDGSVTLTMDQLDGLAVTPAADSDADFQLTVAVTTTDADSGDTKTVTDTMDVTVGAVADAPSLVVQAASGDEDAAIALDVTAALTDTDGSETLSVEISGIPDGAVLTAGGDAVTVTNGVATLTSDQLSDLAITPPSDESSNFDLTVTATSTESGSSSFSNGVATSTATLSVTVDAVADDPSLTVSAASGDEDTAIDLDISAALSDGTETLTLEISGIPDGAVLASDGDPITVTNGTATLTPAQLENLTVTPPEDSSENFSLTVTAISTDGSDTATTVGTIPVTVDAVADAPSLSVESASGNEDSAIELDISAAVTDGSETLSVEISNIPDGASLTAGGVAISIVGGVATLTAGQLDALEITPPSNSDADFTLTVTATSTDGSDTATTVGSIPVSVAGVADAPSLSVTLGDGTSVGETTETDPETTNIANSGPLSFSGASASSDVAYATGTITMTADDGGTFNVQSVEIGQYGGSSATLTAYDADGNVIGTHTVNLPSEYGAPNTIDLSGVNGFDNVATLKAVASPSGNYIKIGDVVTTEFETTEAVDTTFPLDLSAALVDTDGSETLSVEIGNLPDGVSLTVDGTAVTITDGSVTLNADQLSNLSLTVPNGSSDFDLSITATSTETGGSTATTTQSVTIDMPELPGETITGTAGDDTLTGTARGDVITGDGGGTTTDVDAVFHFKLEDTTWNSNETVTDSVNGVTGTAKGGTGTSTDGVDGSAAQFDGSGDYIEVPHSDAMELSSGTFTVDFTAWNNGTIASKDSSNYDDGGHFNLKVNSSREVELRVQTDSESFTIKGGDISWDSYHNATLTWDGTTVTLYVDGEAVGSAETDYSMAPNDNPWTFGASQMNSSDDVADNLHTYLDGKIDNPALFDTVLTADQVSSMVSNGVETSVENGITTTSTALAEVSLLSEDFSNGSGSFTYSDNIVSSGGSSGTVSIRPEDYVDGEHTSDGETGGGLAITLGGIDGNDLEDMSGGWTTTVSVTEETQNTTVTFSYRMVYPANAESDEAAEVRVSLNGDLVSYNGQDYVARTVGDGDSGTGEQDSGWQTVTLDLGTLPVGDHEITLGGFFEKKTASDEEVEIFFDNIAVTGDVPSIGGDDTINAGAGDDTIYAGAGDDVVNAGAGNDVIDLSEAGTATATAVSHWKLDETSGSTVKDNIGSNDGSVHGNTVLDFSGNFGSGADLDGSNDYIQIPHDSSLELESGSLTFSFNGDQQQNTLISKGDNGDGAGQFQITTRDNGKVRFEFTDDDGDSVRLEGGSIDWGNWNNVTVSWGSDGLKLYLNGEEVDTESGITNGIDTNSEPMRIGVRDDIGDDFNGAFDDIAFFDSQLSASDVSNISSNGVDSFLNPSDSDGQDTVDAGTGNDTVIGGEGADTLDGGDGTDTLSYANSDEAVTIDFGNGTVSGGDAAGDQISNFENAVGSDHNDTLIGDSGANRLDGGSGSDELTGGGGADVFVLGSPNDGLDTITDFNADDGDMLDISSVVNVDDVDELQNYLKLEEDDDGNTTVKVNTSGDGADENFTAVATIEGVTGLDMNSIIQDQNNGGGDV